MLIEQLNRLDNIYDLMALCGVYIFHEFKRMPYDFLEFEDELYNSVYDAIDEYSFAKREKGRKRAFSELKNFIIRFLGQEVCIEKCYAIIKYIDELVEIELAGSLLENPSAFVYSHINKLYLNEIRIIPKRKDTFFSRKEAQIKKADESKYDFFRESRECECSLLDKQMNNYMLWDKERIDRYPFKIYYFNEKHPVTKHFLKSDQLVFGIVPFTNGKLEDILDIHLLNRSFEVSNMKQQAEQNLRKRFSAIYEKCENRNIDFLIYPEMLMTLDLVHSVKKSERYGSPWLFVSGSIWKDLENSSCLFDKKGNLIFSYNKKEPFVYKSKYIEHLDNTKNKEYAILEIEKFGRIGIAICKDLVNEDIKNFHKYMKTNLLFVPAYTESMDLQSAAGELSRDYKCIVIMANACSALNKGNGVVRGERIGFVSLPAKNNSDRAELIKMYIADKCMENCSNECAGKVITIDFGRKETYEAGTSYKIEMSTF